LPFSIYEAFLQHGFTFYHWLKDSNNNGIHYVNEHEELPLAAPDDKMPLAGRTSFRDDS